MHHTIYKITNLINGKIYIGKHSTNDIKDNYYGSGKLIKSAIEKYGIINFTKEILFNFQSEEEAYAKEKEIVNESFIKRKDVYNLIIGGDTFEAINSNLELRKAKNKKAALIMNSVNWNNPEFRKRQTDKMILQNKKLHKEGILKSVDWTGKKHKDESKEKMREKAKLRIGDKNSSFGTCWIYNENESKKIKKEDLENYLSIGWIKGRKIKF